MSTDAILRAALETAQVVPRVDNTGLGLLHLGVEQPLAVAGLTQMTPVVSGLTSSSGTILNEPVLSTVTGQPAVVATMSELRGVRLDGTWTVPAGPGSRPLPGPESRDGLASVAPGTLVPLSRTPTLHVVHGALQGLSALFLPVPHLTPSPATWDARVDVTLEAIALQGLIDDGEGSGDLALDGVVALRRPPSWSLSVPVTAPTLVVPPILMLCTGTDLQPPAIVIIPLPHLGGPRALLTDLAAVAQRVDLVRRLLVTARLSVPLFDQVSQALSAMNILLASSFTLLHVHPAEPDLNLLEPKAGVGKDTVGDPIRSLAYLSLPGPRVSLYKRKHFIGPRLDLEITPQMASPERGDLIVVIPDLEAFEPTDGATMTGNLGYGTSSYRFERHNATPAPVPHEFTKFFAAVGGRSSEKPISQRRRMPRSCETALMPSSDPLLDDDGS